MNELSETIMLDVADRVTDLVRSMEYPMLYNFLEAHEGIWVVHSLLEAPNGENCCVRTSLAQDGPKAIALRVRVTYGRGLSGVVERSGRLLKRFRRPAWEPSFPSVAPPAPEAAQACCP